MFPGSYGIRMREQGVESMEENHLTWLIMRFSLYKKGDKSDGLGETDGLNDWMSLKSKVRMSECKNVRKGFGRGLLVYKTSREYLPIIWARTG